METEKVSRNQKELVMSDLGTSNAVRRSKMTSQDKIRIEKVVSCDEKFCLGYRLRVFWEVADICIHSNCKSERVRFERLYRFFIWFTYRWVNWQKSWKRCWAYHGIPSPNMSTIFILGNLLLFEFRFEKQRSSNIYLSIYEQVLWSNH